jgi:hypothetical protein
MRAYAVVLVLVRVGGFVGGFVDGFVASFAGGLAPLALYQTLAVAATPERNPETEPRPVSIDTELIAYGRVINGELQAEVPVSDHVALVPSTELLYLAPIGSEAHEFHPHVGAGITGELAGDWDWELSLDYAPRSSEISSIGAAAGVSVGFGADWKHDRAPTLDLESSARVTHFMWSAGSPIGGDVTQLHLESTLSMRIFGDLQLSVRDMFFFYDRSLASPDSAVVDALGVLASVGSFPPSVVVGVGLVWKPSAFVAPIARGDQITYATDIGAASLVEVGVRFRFTRSLHLTLAGGFLHNELRGAANRLPDRRTSPLLHTALELEL